MENIKIFVDCHVFDGPYQGTTSYLKGLYSQLINNKTILFYLASNNPENLEKIFGRHANVVYLKYRFKNKYLRLFLDIPSMILKFKITFAHYQYIVSPIKRCRNIVTVHDVMFLDFPEYFPTSYKIKNKFLFKWSAKNSDIVLTVSDYSKRRIQKHFNLEKIVVTTNAVDSIYSEKHQKSISKEYIKTNFGIKDFFLFVSRFEPRKNHLTLLKVFVENEHYLNRELVFIGNDALECKALDMYYNSLTEEIKAKVKFLKKVNFNDLLLFTRAADLSVYPSIAEGFGIPPLESIAATTPTICSNATAMSDFDFIHEFLFNPLDEKEMNEKIHQALSYTDWKNKKLEMLKKYNWEDSANEFLNAIDSIHFSTAK